MCSVAGIWDPKLSKGKAHLVDVSKFYCLKKLFILCAGSFCSLGMSLFRILGNVFLDLDKSAFEQCRFWLTPEMSGPKGPPEQQYTPQHTYWAHTLLCLSFQWRRLLNSSPFFSKLSFYTLTRPFVTMTLPSSAVPSLPLTLSLPKKDKSSQYWHSIINTS